MRPGGYCPRSPIRLGYDHPGGPRTTTPPTEPTTSRDVFISHSSDDADAARALRTIIEGAGYSCWMAPDDIVGTGTWTEQILAAIADSKAMIVLISAASNRSAHVSREVNLALGKGRAVLPIRIEDVPPQGSLEYLLSLVQRVDAFPPPIADHRDRVMHRLQTIVRPDDTTRVLVGAAPLAGASAPPTLPVTPPAAPPPPASAAPAPQPVSALPPNGYAPVPTPPPPPVRASLKRPSPIVLGGAIAVILIALVAGSLIFKGPGATPGPTQAAGATSGAGASAAATAASSGAVATAGATSGSLSADEAAAQARLPVVNPGTTGCTSWIAAPGGNDVLSPSGYATSLARLTCAGPNGSPTRYAMYPTKEALDADFASIMNSQGVAAGGACTNAIPANAGWNFPAIPTAGDLACYARAGGVQYVWSDHELRVLGQWLAPDNATGLAFWQKWEQARTPAEQALVAVLPTITGVGACDRAADDYYPTALAILACPRTEGGAPVYYAGFGPADAFPNDPMTTQFFSIMNQGGVSADTSTGCYESSFGRYTWGYKQTDGSIGPSQGYLGCFQRTDTEPATAQIVWTFNKTAVMGLWDAADVDTATKLFDSWITAVK